MLSAHNHRSHPSDNFLPPAPRVPGAGLLFQQPVVAERVANLFKVGILDGVVH
jgi:hypothetical protein